MQALKTTPRADETSACASSPHPRLHGRRARGAARRCRRRGRQARARRRSWAQAEIRIVAARGLLGGDAAAFRPDDALTERELAELAAGLKATTAARAVRTTAPVTLASLDARLVRTLGLADAAAALQRTARRSRAA